MSEKTVPNRTAEMWYRDFGASVELLSEPPDAQLARMEQWQIDSDAIKLRFQLEWEEFKRLHYTPIPLKVAERLDWLAQLISRMPSGMGVNHGHWAEIRSAPRGVLPSMRAPRENSWRINCDCTHRPERRPPAVRVLC